MNREWLLAAKILTGICTLALSSVAQTYTVSAKPGALNFIQGAVAINGDPVWKANLKSTFLNAGDVLAVDDGKAEVLLNPGVFLRLGEHSQVRMIQPSLIETQLEVLSGEAMIEVDDFVPGSSIAVMDHGSATTLTKPGLFRFTDHSIAALDGKADVAFGDHKVALNKNREVQIDDTLHAGKVDLNQPDDLYAWSNTRAQYNAAASYAGSTAAYNSGGYGYSSFSSPGWYWASGFNSYMWMPGNGAFYSPFGWGFYGPGVVAYAPVIGIPYYGGYGYGLYAGRGAPVKVTTSQLTVPVNPRGVGVSSAQVSSPAAFAAARVQAQNYTNFYGLQTSQGRPAAMLRGGQTFSNMQAASHAASESARAASYSGGGSRSSASYPSLASGGSPSSASSRATGNSGGGGGFASHASSGGGHSK